jgi:hypothetical protein
VTTTTSLALAALLSVGLVAPVLAAEDVTEHETYEKRSMKIETVPMAPPATVQAPTRAYEHHDSSESTTVERHATPPPAAVVKERTTDSVEIHEKN